MTKQLTGTREWACKTVNVCMGCSHDCAYCYAKSMAIRFGRSTVDAWKQQTALPAKLSEAGRGKPTRIMFPSTHDITPECMDICLDALTRMLSKGHEVLVVSKPHLACIREICERFPAFRDKLVFRFTIGSTSNAVLKAWEPDAPAYEERLASLELAHAHGYQTSVSCEPMLDTQVENVVRAVEGFVTETVWIGLMNDVKQRLTLNGAAPEMHKMGTELIRQCSREMISDLHGRLKDNPKIRWKDSIKKMLGLERLTRVGMDIRECTAEGRAPMTTAIWTMGTQGQHDEPFLGLLRRHAVDAVIDIRLHSEGRYFKFASGKHIRALVEGAGLAYRHEVAFAPTAAMLKAYKSGGEWASYELAYQNLIAERQMGDLWTAEYSRYERPCLLCAEVEQVHCHRRLFAEFLAKEFGVPIVHLAGGRKHDNN